MLAAKREAHAQAMDRVDRLRASIEVSAAILTVAILVLTLTLLTKKDGK